MKCSGNPVRKKEGVKGLRRGAIDHANWGKSTDKEALKITDIIPGERSKDYKGLDFNKESSSDILYSRQSSFGPTTGTGEEKRLDPLRTTPIGRGPSSQDHCQQGLRQEVESNGEAQMWANSYRL